MATKTSEGRIILSASEVGAYTVCPESWRLRSLLRKRSVPSPARDEGERLHARWADSIDLSLFLFWGSRVLLLLFLIALLLFIFGVEWRPGAGV